MPDEPKGHYVRNKDGTWTWVGCEADLNRYWYERGRADGRKEAESGAPRR